MSNASKLYREIEVNSEALAASPHRLVQMLLEKCVQQIHLAKTHIANNDVKLKHRTIARASEIVDYLRLCLNFEDKRTEKLAKQLDELYQFLERSLLLATLEDNADYLEKAKLVLGNIKEGWDGITEKV